MQSSFPENLPFPVYHSEKRDTSAKSGTFILEVQKNEENPAAEFPLPDWQIFFCVIRCLVPASR
jgi:hypothetical protein